MIVATYLLFFAVVVLAVVVLVLDHRLRAGERRLVQLEALVMDRPNRYELDISAFKSNHPAAGQRNPPTYPIGAGIFHQEGLFR